MADVLLRFTFRDAPVRGEVVNLHGVWQQMTAFHSYPPPVTRLLGEMTAATALLAATIKFNGALIMQVHGDGPVKLLVVECQPDLRLRATAKLRGEMPIAMDAGMRELVNLEGRGRCALTLDPRESQAGQQPYQGIVPLEGDSIAHALESYLRRSEQLESRLWLAADGASAAGALLQKLPQDGGRAQTTADPDAWDRALALAGTLTPNELLAADADTVTRRLFWQEVLDHYPRLVPRFECRCSRERIGRMLLSLGRDEAESILAERGKIEVTCDFCNARQEFDAVDVGHLFATGASAGYADAARH
ncbi:MAG TPA: Hsp33 family molecular chaperone HslO [Burkholderiaceae bacterium]|nr:Hsp33 family molecular chaperone HslO [Burkholderiaceae bacterium]